MALFFHHKTQETRGARALVHPADHRNLSFSSWASSSSSSSSSSSPQPHRPSSVAGVMNCGGATGQRKQRVVVVGGGVAGSLLARRIQFHADVVLIDPKEYFEIPWANMRSKVDPSVAERSLINHIDYLTHGRVITSTAVGVNETEVITIEDRRVEYDFLVIATGHTVGCPRSRRDRLEQFQEDNVKIKNSDSILIIGGGPTGVELAGEIAVDHPDKKVTLVHNGPRLLEFISPKASNKTLEWLKAKNVKVLLNQSVDLDSLSDADREFKTSTAEVVKADCYFTCVDRPLGSSWFKDSFLGQFMNAEGRLMVDENLRVGSQNNVFAIGDITDVPELKQGFLAQRHAEIVAKNLKLLMKARSKECKLYKYKPSSAVAMVSLSRKDAVAQLPFTTVIGIIPGVIKTKYLFVNRTRRKMGLD